MNVSAYPIPMRGFDETSHVHPEAGILFPGEKSDGRYQTIDKERIQSQVEESSAREISKEQALEYAAPTPLGRAIASEGIKGIRYDHSIRKEDLDVTHRVKIGAPTNQSSSGRCWIFASLNMLRSASLDAYGEKFAYSQNYIAFWDKIERANFYLERMIALADHPRDDRLMDNIRSSAFTDGGEWVYFKNIVKKYGLVPDYAMPETKFSGQSRAYNSIIQGILKEQATILQKMVQDGASRSEVTAHKEKVMQKVITALTKFLGAPPRDFRWKDQDGIRRQMTPLEFAEQSPVKLDDYVEVSFLKEEKEGLWLKLKDTNNMVGGDSHASFNLGIDEGLEALRKSIKDGSPALCMSEVKSLDFPKTLFSIENDQTESLLGMDDLPKLSKSDRLQAGVTTIAHAMMFIGCDEASTSRFEGDPALRKEIDGPLWLVENSWEDATEVFMTDKWVREYLYEMVIPKKYLSEARQNQINDPFTSSLSLPNWHYMANV